MMKHQKFEFPEKRQYIRLNSVFPVGIELTDGTGRKEFYQGFTRDISSGGLCIEACNIKEEWLDRLVFSDVVLGLYIDMPLGIASIHAEAKAVWVKKTIDANPPKLLIGAKYTQINESERKRIVNFARKLIALPKVTVAVLAMLAITAGLFYFNNTKLELENRMLINKVNALSAKENNIRERLNILTAENVNLENLVKNNEQMMVLMQDRVREIEEGKTGKLLESEKLFTEKENMLEILRIEKEKLEQHLKIVLMDNKRLKQKIGQNALGEVQLKNKLEALSDKRIKLSDKTTLLLYNWLVLAQDQGTGLVSSYDTDKALTDFAFTYDQALAALSFINFAEHERAARIFNFYLNSAKKIDSGFANAYDVRTGEVLEYTVHTGPNVLLGIAVLWYTKQTHDYTYLNMAEGIADWLISLQKDDGGIRGGPNIVWASTEHNIDAYAFLEMLEQMQADTKYAQALAKIETWIIDVAYNKKHLRFNRGENDIFIATDTAALAIAAVGPEKLKKLGIDLDALVKCIEENCRVNILYGDQNNKKVSVAGFDFSNPSSIGRKGIISTEWTAQMVIAYQMLSNYYAAMTEPEKSLIFDQKAKFYLNELEKMVLLKSVFSDKEGAGLPYASCSNMDTGHGWFTPEATAISVAGTAYNLFARKNYNPYRM